jgi:hypothetical protein
LYRSVDNFRSLDHFQSLALENDLIDCFLHLPLSENIPFILTYANIAQARPGDAQLQTLRAQKPNQYIQKLLAPNLSLWCFQKAPNRPWRIYLPHALLERAVKWYHHALSHVGQKRLIDTMSLTFYNPKLYKILTEIVRLFNHTSAHAATVFTNTWLAQYPKPTICIYDQGSEFIGWAFQNMLTQYNIQR